MPIKRTATSFATAVGSVVALYACAEQAQNSRQSTRELGTQLSAATTWRLVEHSDWDLNETPSLREARVSAERVTGGVHLSAHDGCNGMGVTKPDADGRPVTVRFARDGAVRGRHTLVCTAVGCEDPQGRYLGVDVERLVNPPARWSVAEDGRLTIEADGTRAVFAPDNASGNG